MCPLATARGLSRNPERVDAGFGGAGGRRLKRRGISVIFCGAVRRALGNQQRGEHSDHASRVGNCFGRLRKLLDMTDVDFHIDEVTGEDKVADVVEEILQPGEQRGNEAVERRLGSGQVLRGLARAVS